MISWTKTNIADESHIHEYNFKWLTPHSHGTDNNFCHVSVYSHFTQYKNYNYHWSSNYSAPCAGCFTCLISFKLYNKPMG